MSLFIFYSSLGSCYLIFFYNVSSKLPNSCLKQGREGTLTCSEARFLISASSPLQCQRLSPRTGPSLALGQGSARSSGRRGTQTRCVGGRCRPAWGWGQGVVRRARVLRAHSLRFRPPRLLAGPPPLSSPLWGGHRFRHTVLRAVSPRPGYFLTA